MSQLKLLQRGKCTLRTFYIELYLSDTVIKQELYQGRHFLSSPTLFHEIYQNVSIENVSSHEMFKKSLFL